MKSLKGICCSLRNLGELDSGACARTTHIIGDSYKRAIRDRMSTIEVQTRDACGDACISTSHSLTATFTAPDGRPLQIHIAYVLFSLIFKVIPNFRVLETCRRGSFGGTGIYPEINTSAKRHPMKINPLPDFFFFFFWWAYSRPEFGDDFLPWVCSVQGNRYLPFCFTTRRNVCLLLFNAYKPSISLTDFE